MNETPPSVETKSVLTEHGLSTVLFFFLLGVVWLELHPSWSSWGERIWTQRPQGGQALKGELWTLNEGSSHSPTLAVLDPPGQCNHRIFRSPFPCCFFIVSELFTNPFTYWQSHGSCSAWRHVELEDSNPLLSPLTASVRVRHPTPFHSSPACFWTGLVSSRHSESASQTVVTGVVDVLVYTSPDLQRLYFLMWPQYASPLQLGYSEDAEHSLPPLWGVLPFCAVGRKWQCCQNPTPCASPLEAMGNR